MQWAGTNLGTARRCRLLTPDLVLGDHAMAPGWETSETRDQKPNLQLRWYSGDAVRARSRSTLELPRREKKTKMRRGRREKHT